MERDVINKVVEDIKSAQESIRKAPKALNEKKEALQESLTEQRNDLQVRVNALVERLRRQVTAVRHNGQERVWSFETNALEAVEGMLSKGDDTRLEKLTSGLEDLVTRRLDAVTAPRIENYDDLNAKDSIRALRGLDWLDLLKVARYEELTRNRKTVLQAVERALAGIRAEA